MLMLNLIRLISLIGLAVLIGPIGVFASSKADIVHPTQELGNCRNETECRNYCKNPSHLDNCLNFAEKHNLMSPEEITLAKRMGKKQGPGGCVGESCRDYCDDINHIDECLAFAEAEDLMSDEELAEAKKVQTALKKGAKLPSGCKNKEQCEAICDNPANEAVARQCFAFAKTAGFIPEGVPEELAITVMTKGGPGGCKREQCDTFCQENPTICMNWMREQGIDPVSMMPPEAKRMMEQGRQMLLKMLSGGPPQVKNCIEKTLGPESLKNLHSGGIFGGPELREQIEDCMMDVMGPMGPMGGRGGPMQFSGPGDCHGEEDCRAYCEEARYLEDDAEAEKRMDECDAFTEKMEEMRDLENERMDNEESSEDYGEDYEEIDFSERSRGMLPGDLVPTGMPSIPGGCQPGPNMMKCIMDYCMKNFMTDPACQMPQKDQLGEALSSLRNSRRPVSYRPAGGRRIARPLFKLQASKPTRLLPTLKLVNEYLPRGSFLEPASAYPKLSPEETYLKDFGRKPQWLR